MSRMHLSRADSIYVGAGQYAPVQNGKMGLPMTPLYMHDFGTPAAASASALISAATGAELPNATTTTYTYPGAASPLDGALATGILDVARNVVAVATHASAVIAMDILVTGLDTYGDVISELLAITAGTTSKTATGGKAFKSITSVAITSAGVSTTNTLNLGTGVKLGLPHRVDENGVIVANVDGARDVATFVEAVTSTATTTTGDVRGTVQQTSAPDGVKKMNVFYKIADISTKIGAYGVDNA